MCIITVNNLFLKKKTVKNYNWKEKYTNAIIPFWINLTKKNFAFGLNWPLTVKKNNIIPLTKKTKLSAKTLSKNTICFIFSYYIKLRKTWLDKSI